MRNEVVRLKFRDWGLYNNPEINERKIELPLAFWFLDRFRGDVIEIGEVTPFYARALHRVYDFLPEKPESFKIDANDLDYRGKNTLAISTIEHIGSGDYGLQPVPHLAVSLLAKIVNDSRNYLITFAVGSNRELERDLIAARISYFIIERTEQNGWRQMEHLDLSKYSYGQPQPHGNAIVVITNLNKQFEIDGYDII